MILLKIEKINSSSVFGLKESEFWNMLWDIICWHKIYLIHIFNRSTISICFGYFNFSQLIAKIIEYAWFAIDFMILSRRNSLYLARWGSNNHPQIGHKCGPLRPFCQNWRKIGPFYNKNQVNFDKFVRLA